jgi:hypothetical protein
MLKLGSLSLLFFTFLCISAQAGLNELAEGARDISQAGPSSYNGETELSRDQTLSLLREIDGQADVQQTSQGAQAITGQVRCRGEAAPIGVASSASTDSVSSATESDESDWRVVFLARVSARSSSQQGQSVSPVVAGSSRFGQDLTQINNMISAGTFSAEELDSIIDDTGEALGGDPMAAMAYVSAMGAKLDESYGASHAGRFVTTFEQFGRLSRGESSGQCSDIHYSMLRAYKRMVPNGRAYLVNYQTAKNLHHTNLVIEHEGQIYIVDYGNISRNGPDSNNMLAQTIRPDHGIAYRIFGEGTEENDQMLAHIDSPLGKFLREVSTGRASYNPFESTNYGLMQIGLDNQSSGSHVRIFFGEIGQGDIVTGVAVNLQGATELGAGFRLEGHFSTALSYAYRQFQNAGEASTLHSEILYINTGFGFVSPNFTVGDFTFSGRTDFVLEGGFWIKQFSGSDSDDSMFEGDGNLINRTRIQAIYQPSDRIQLRASGEIEVMPTFGTAFPSSTDGSSGAEGLVDTLGIGVNRVTTALDLTYRTDTGIDIFGGITYQYTGLGSVGRAHVGAGTDTFRASAFVQGALDREETPVFLPGARREIGFNFNWCNDLNSGTISQVCIGGQATHSLENDSVWGANLTTGLRF